MNAKFIGTVGAALVAAAVCADTPKKAVETYKGMTPEQIAAKIAAAQQREMELFGGMVEIPGSQRGKIRFVNAQKKVPIDSAKLLDYFTHNMDYDAQLIEGEPVTPQTAAAARVKIGADIAVFAVEDPTLGIMLTAPEERWALVNIAPLLADNPKPAFQKARLRKELLRAIAYLTAGSTHEGTLMDITRTPKDLDKIARERFPVDVTIRMFTHLDRLGITQRESDSYSNCILNGYEIPPTNKYQKAVYDKAKATRAKK